MVNGLKILIVKWSVIIDMTIDMNLKIEEVVQKTDISYMDAVLEYAMNAGIEPEAIGKMLNQSIKDKIEVETQELHMLKKTAKLPI